MGGGGLASLVPRPLRHPLCIFHYNILAYMPQQCVLLIMPIDQGLIDPPQERGSYQQLIVCLLRDTYIMPNNICRERSLIEFIYYTVAAAEHCVYQLPMFRLEGGAPGYSP
jgi:hypothetical protein